MKYLTKLTHLILSFLMCFFTYAQEEKIPYGSNESTGNFATVNDVKLYYEEYGSGEPLLLIHGNGGSISGLNHQIDYFKSKYRVIIADGRGHGKSGLNTDSLTYRQMANDLEGLAKHLKLDSLNIIGTSDGAIIGLMMGINNNVKIKRIAAFAGNLRPDTTAVHPWAPASVKQRETRIKNSFKNKEITEYWKIRLLRAQLMLYQPNISHDELKKITSPVLIIAGDRDVIKNEHSVEMFNNIPKSQLCIIPGGTHWTPYQQPEIFNEIVYRFLSEPFSMPATNSPNN